MVIKPVIYVTDLISPDEVRLMVPYCKVMVPRGDFVKNWDSNLSLYHLIIWIGFNYESILNRLNSMF